AEWKDNVVTRCCGYDNTRFIYKIDSVSPTCCRKPPMTYRDDVAFFGGASTRSQRVRDSFSHATCGNMGYWRRETDRDKFRVGGPAKVIIESMARKSKV